MVSLDFKPLSHTDAISASTLVCAVELSKSSAVVAMKIPTYSSCLSRQPVVCQSTPQKDQPDSAVLGSEMGACTVGCASECCL